MKARLTDNRLAFELRAHPARHQQERQRHIGARPAAGTWGGRRPLRSSLRDPSHSAGHSFSGAKSQVFLGTRKPRRAAVTTRASPTRPPIRGRELGAEQHAGQGIGTVKASPAKIANGRMESPSVQLRLRPKKRVSIITISTGIRVPTVA